MQVRRVRADEWERIRDFRLRALLDAPDAFGSTHEREAAQDEVAWRGFADGWDGAARQAAFAAEADDGSWVGIALGVVWAADPQVANLYAMWVEPDARGLGAGRALVGSVAAWSSAMGAATLELCVTESNPAAIALYERTGFVPTGARAELRPGTFATTMRRPLTLPAEDVEALLEEQKRYYEDRAPVYDQLFFREGRYDRGPEFNAKWAIETDALEASLIAFDPRGSVLELASGTGIWTRFLAPRADRLVAIDTSEAVLARNAEVVGDPKVEYVQADLFAWEPPAGERFDAIVFGFFISHVPPDRLAAFWERVRSWLAPGGRVWFCDDVEGPGRPYSGDTVEDIAFANHRRMDTDRDYRIVKLFWAPDDLTARLADLGWDAEVGVTGEYFFHATAVPSTPT
jgi:ribosomal protein S18 acetylase RimI-like enzyme/SAM-dependent methyltransferase